MEASGTIFKVLCDWYAIGDAQHPLVETDEIHCVAYGASEAIASAKAHVSEYPLYPLSTFSVTNFRIGV